MDEPGKGHGCRRLLAVAALVVTVACPATTAAAPSTTPADDFITNGDVGHVTRTAERTYLFGDFDYVGPRTGYGIGMSASGAQLSGFPEINGRVFAAVRDGAGGWFVGGDFDRVGGVARVGLARILANGTVDPTFDPVLTSGGLVSVRALAFATGKLYVAGSFATVDGVARPNFALINAPAGTLDPAWQVSVGGLVNAMLVSGARVYLAGSFGTINGTTRNGLGAVDAASGALDTTFVANLALPASSPSAHELTLISSTLFVAGRFATINGTARPGIAALSATSGAVDSTFAANLTGISADETFTALTRTGTRLLAGSDTGRLVAIDANTGARDTTFVPQFEGGGITTLAFNGSSVLFVGGDFTRAGGARRLRFAAVNPTTGAVQSSAIQSFSHPPTTIVPSETTTSRVFVGGQFTSAGGEARPGIAALDASGSLDAGFAPAPLTDRLGNEARIRASAIGDGRLYLGGDMNAVGEQRLNVIAVDPATGARLPGFGTDPVTYGEVHDLVLRDRRLYVAGSFDDLARPGYRNLVALDPATGAALPGFAANPDERITAIALVGTRLYATGEFTTIGGLTRPKVAALDARTGAADPAFTVGVEGPTNVPVLDVLADGTRVFLGGNFTAVNGAPRSNLAAVSPATGATISTWTPTTDGVVLTLASAGVRVLAGGTFRNVDGMTRRAVAALDRSSGALDPWNVRLGEAAPGSSASGSAQTISVAHGRVDVGGAFGHVMRRGQHAIASFAVDMPVSFGPPEVTGTPPALSCDPSVWSGGPTFAFEWLRDGRTVAAGQTYAVTSADAGHALSCRVIATNGEGAAERISAERAIAPAPPPVETPRTEPPAASPPPGPPAAVAQPPRHAPVTGGSSATALTASITTKRVRRARPTVATRCSASATATATLKAGRRTLGTGKAACGKALKLKLRKAARKARRATLTVVFTRPGAKAVTVKREVTLS